MDELDLVTLFAEAGDEFSLDSDASDGEEQATRPTSGGNTASYTRMEAPPGVPTTTATGTPSGSPAHVVQARGQPSTVPSDGTSVTAGTTPGGARVRRTKRHRQATPAALAFAAQSRGIAFPMAASSSKGAGPGAGADSGAESAADDVGALEQRPAKRTRVLLEPAAAIATAAATAKEKAARQVQARKARRLASAVKSGKGAKGAKGGKAAQAKKREKREIDRKSRNRESAALSRLRKKLYTAELENKVKELTTTNAELAARVAALERLTDALAQQVAASHSDPVTVEANTEAQARAREAAQAAEVAAVNGYARSAPVVAPVGQGNHTSMALDALLQPQPFNTAAVEQMTFGGDMRAFGLAPITTSAAF